MTFRTLIISAVTLSALAILGSFAAPSAAARSFQSTGGVCSLELRVKLAEDGSIASRSPGTAHCAGQIGRAMVDPGRAAAAVSGRWRRGGTRCEPTLLSGELRVEPRRLISFDARSEIPFSGSWKAAGAGPVVAFDGTGVSQGLTMSFAGTARLVPAALDCTLHTLQMEIAFMPR